MLRKQSGFSLVDIMADTDTTMNLYTAQFKDAEPLEDLVMDTFRNTLQQYEVELELTDAERNEYKMVPKSLSFKLYGTSDLFFILMVLNNISHPADFLADNNNITVYTTDGIKELLKYYDNYHSKF